PYTTLFRSRGRRAGCDRGRAAARRGAGGGRLAGAFEEPHRHLLPRCAAQPGKPRPHRQPRGRRRCRARRPAPRTNFMTFATDLVTELELATAGQPIPRVRALHLPPPEAAASKNGEFCALELDDGALGISYVLLDDTLQRLIDSGDGGGIVGMDALELARVFAAPPRGTRMGDAGDV